MSNLPDHIQTDLDTIAPLWAETARIITTRHEFASDDSKMAFFECADRWRWQEAQQQFLGILDYAARGDSTPRASSASGAIVIGSKTAHNLRHMDTSGITTGPNTRMLKGLISNHSEVGLTARDVRAILNQAAANLGIAIKDTVPELMPFMKGLPLANAVVGRA